MCAAVAGLTQEVTMSCQSFSHTFHHGFTVQLSLHFFSTPLLLEVERKRNLDRYYLLNSEVVCGKTSTFAAS